MDNLTRQSTEVKEKMFKEGRVIDNLNQKAIALRAENVDLMIMFECYGWSNVVMRTRLVELYANWEYGQYDCFLPWMFAKISYQDAIRIDVISSWEEDKMNKKKDWMWNISFSIVIVFMIDDNKWALLLRKKILTPMWWKSFGDYGHYKDNCKDKDYCQSLRSFTTDIIDEIRVMGVYAHRMESHMTEKTLMNHKSVNWA